MSEFYDVYAATLQELGMPEALPHLIRHVELRMTVDAIRALLEQSGFMVLSVRQETRSMRFLDGSALLGHAFIQLGFVEAWRSIVPSDKQGFVFQALRRNLDRHARTFGELRLFIPMACFMARKPASASE